WDQARSAWLGVGKVGGGEDDLGANAPAVHGLEPGSAAPARRKRLDDRQPEPGSGGCAASSVEALERVSRDLVVQRPRVADHAARGVAVVARALDPHRGAVRRVLDGVLDQVVEDRRQLALTRPDDDLAVALERDLVAALARRPAPALGRG